ncbi:bifunctional adenosylcobinamide kinase/adenosylcobinamide-phosphate guanylyltransferase [Clostridium sp.]|uniref:bifunctional adenosylcobinamide kinase/adenosylcobinamide-phosphate guanylyltransferase n=1 Tax=Clostridium sp. TaxID=1506 RepID=UPI0026389D4D|nr:bifunctional adenosylcobinamide kinase/adenosylcobinamide-phosphate guanylyltransferase [Clostridium sp.]
MKILIIGGSKSSKSSYGELFSYRLSKKEKGTLYYIATMNPYDLEDLKRIENHLENRKDYDFETVEKHRDLNEIIETFSENDTVLLDSLTSLVTNEMFNNENFNEFIASKIINHIVELGNKVKNMVIVSDYVFSDCIIYDSYTENFRRELGNITCNLAKNYDVVIEASFGNLIVHKGKEMLESENLI